jgi:hypothetical protein
MKYIVVIIFFTTLLLPVITLADHRCEPDGTEPPHPTGGIWGHTCTTGGVFWKDVTCYSTQEPCDLCDAAQVTINVVNFLMNIGVTIAVGMIVYGAIMMMIAGGQPDKITRARKAITMAIIGAIVTLAAWAIVNTTIHIITGDPAYPWQAIECV